MVLLCVPCDGSSRLRRTLQECILCGRRDFSRAKLKTDLSLVQCDSCGLISLDVPSRQKYAQDVQREFFEDERLPGWLEGKMARTQARRRLKEILSRKKSGKLLEVGPGFGDLLRLARECGFQCQGIEPSPTLGEIASSRSGVPVQCMRVEDLKTDNRFDVIVFSHVLEHIPQVDMVLHRLRRLLNPGGILYIAVPNVDSWEAKFPGWISYQPYHLFYFSSVTLSGILDKSGFEMVECSTFEPFSGWTNAIIRTCLPRFYDRGRDAAQTASAGHAWRGSLNLVRIGLGILSTPFRWVQAALGRGEELVAIARV